MEFEKLRKRRSNPEPFISRYTPAVAGALDTNGRTASLPRRTVVVMIAVLVMVQLGFAISGERYQADASKSALGYLRLPVSARVAALGGAVSAMGDDAASALINPALAARTSVTRITASGEKMTLDRGHYFAGILYPLHFTVSTIGLGWIQYGVGGIEERDENGFWEGEFSDLENTIVLLYGGGIGRTLFAGLTAKYHTQKLRASQANGFSADVGIFHQASKMFHWSLVAHNLGWKFKWDTGHSDTLAPSFRIGSSVYPYKENLAISSDLEWTPGNFLQGHGGIEAWIAPQFCIRAGVQAPNPIMGSGGFGIRYNIRTSGRILPVSVDYSFVYHQSELGHSHLISLSADIGAKIEESH